MGLQEQGWFMDRVREFFGFLDKLVYGLIRWILFGIFDLANLSTNSEVFSGIYSRIYVILGIFMAFKLSFAFFQYIIDPESMTGKSDKSLSKLLIRTFVMISALVFLPTILFGQNGGQGLLSRAQTAFLPSLPKVIFGVNSVGGLSAGDNSSQKFTDSIEQSANDITINTLRGFFAPSPDLDSVCGDGTYENTPQIETLDDFSNNINLHCNKGINIDAGILGHTAAVYYKYSYMPFISTVVGVLVALLLLGITLDLAKRIFKLMILEAIAPVPIMSLIDPKGSKDGAFSKWVKSLTSTFLDIFFKLGLVYIIVVFIHLIVNSRESGGLFSNFPKDTGFRGTYLTILLILGLIFFAKEAPKFIKDAMGLKSDGKGLFDDVKSVGKAAGLVAGAAVGTAGVVGSTVGNIKAQHEGNQDYFKGQHVRNSLRNIGAGLSGLAGGTAAMASGLTGKDAGLKSVLKKQQDRNAASFDYRRNGGTLFGRIGSGASRTFTGETAAARVGREIQQNENAQALLKAVTDRASSEMVKSNSTFGSLGKKRDGSSFVDRAGNSLDGVKFNYKETMAAYDAAASSGATTVRIADETGTVHEINREDIAFGKGNLLKENEEDYLLKANNPNYAHTDANGNTIYDIEDMTIETHMNNVNKAGIKNDSGEKIDVRSRGQLKKSQERLGRENATKKLEQSRKKANDKYSASKK